MKKANKDHMLRVSADFVIAYQKKYPKGQKQHGGNLWQKPGMLKNMEEEILDQWSYYHVMKEQLVSILVDIDELIKSDLKPAQSKHLNRIAITIWKLLSEEAG